MSEDRNYLIRQLAYELWEQDNKPPGKHLDYWLLAEKQLAASPTDMPIDESSASAERQPS